MRDLIETPTLTLRPLTHADASAVARILGDARVAHMLRTVPHPLPEGTAERYIERLGGGVAPERALAIRGKGEAALRGVVSVRFFADSDGARLGFWLDPAWWGKGVMSEAVAAVTDALFEDGAPWIEAGVFDDNPASRRILERLGFDFAAAPKASGAETLARLSADAWRARRLDRAHPTA